MITRESATRFVLRVNQEANLTVSIVDEKGIVQASTMSQSVGVFNKFVFDFINGTREYVDVRGMSLAPDYSSGIVAVVEEGKRRVGAVILPGIPEEVRQLAAMVRCTLEIWLEHEAQHKNLHKYNSSRAIFHQALMYGEGISKDVLESRAERLGVRTDCLRISIFMVVEPKADFTWFINHNSENPYAHEQDIVTTSRSNRIAVFKYLDRNKQVLSSYRNVVEEYLQWWKEKLTQLGGYVQFNVGTIQNRLIKYRESYQHAVWLVTFAKCQDEINWFYDYTDLYFKSMLPVKTYQNVFQAYVEQIDPDVLEHFHEVVAALEECNYNLVQASKKMFIHKNTTAFRLEKIKHFLNINPTKISKDRNLVNNLLYYLQHNI